MGFLERALAAGLSFLQLECTIVSGKPRKPASGAGALAGNGSIRGLKTPAPSARNERLDADRSVNRPYGASISRENRSRKTRLSVLPLEFCGNSSGSRIQIRRGDL